jgi:putative SOS response-associated peptidase YedK
MCGRFVSATPPGILAGRFQVDERVGGELPPRWNMAPTDETYAVAERHHRRLLTTFRWGLIPHWADDDKDAARRINARAETLADKPAFRDAFAKTRCIIPADGFYEWETGDGGRKIAHYITRRDGDVLAFAGLYARWNPGEHGPPRLFDDPDEPPVRSCTIVTTTANATLAELHDRMPVVLPESAWAEWLDRDNHDVVALQRLLQPAPDDVLVKRAVAPHVNDVRNDGPELIEIG